MNNYDVVIIGGGLAGITLAYHLPENLKIALLEKGDFKYKKKINTHDYGNLSSNSYGNFPIKNYSVNFSSTKMVGGNNSIWSGWSIPMDKKELKNWPIEFHEMEKYYKIAEKFFKFDSFNSNNYSSEYEKFNNEIWKIKFWQFGNKSIDIKKIFKIKKNITLFKNSEFKEFDIEDNVLKNILFLNKEKIHKISCKVAVIAQGGLESTKTLLYTKYYLNKQIGNENNHLGKFYMEHPHITLGYFYDRNNLVKNFFRKNKNFKPGIFLNKNYTNSMLNASMILDEHDLHSRNDVYKLLFIFRLLNIPKDIFRDRNILSVISQLSGGAIELIKSKIRKKKYIFGIFEQSPNYNSEVSLDDNKKIILNWQISDKDIESIMKIAKSFNEYLYSNISKEVFFDDKIFNSEEWIKNFKNKILGIGHHMGTTKMSNNNNEGVVNENLKLHSLKNLYVCSSSTFPTGGVSHPTFTICALAIRLANHIKEVFSLNKI